MEKIGETFKKHTERRHFLWNYIYYVYTLEKKSATDYSGVEYRIKEKIDSEDVTWFPALGAGDGDPDIEALLGDLQANIDSMNEKAAALTSKNLEYVDTCDKTLRLVGNTNRRLKGIEG